MQGLEIDYNPNNRVAEIVLSLPISYGSEFAICNPNHETLAQKLLKIAGADFYSIIVYTRPLDDALVENPDYAHVTRTVRQPEALELASNKVNQRYFDDKEMARVFDQYELPKKRRNFIPDEINEHEVDLEFELQDEIYVGQHLMKLPEVFSEERSACKYDEDGKKRSRRDFERLWRSRLEALCMPRVYTAWRRVYTAFPKPLCYIDSRSSWHQFYFMFNGENIVYWHGDSGGSGRRETHGRMAHAFMTIEKAGKHIPTTELIFDERNRILLANASYNFRTVERDLCGNYRSDSATVKKLFGKGNLITYEQLQRIRERKLYGYVLDARGKPVKGFGKRSSATPRKSGRN